MAELAEVRATIENLTGRVGALREALRYDEHVAAMAELEEKMSAGDFWENPEKAQGIIEELKKHKAVADPLGEVLVPTSDLAELLEMTEEENDAEALAELEVDAAKVVKQVERLETRALFNGRNDNTDIFFSVHAGAGGNDACECTDLILRMYLRYFERQGWKVEELTITPGEDAGLRGATYRVAGDMVYGHMRSEIGVHRIVRISPFSGKRETSFVGVDAMPEYKETTVELDENDVRVDTYRSSGKGGQHVNKTDSAVRLTHLPTGIVVAVQNERSQHKNKATAMKILKSRMQRLEDSKREKVLADMYGEKGEIAFGSQIRNYVFQPYTQVKDQRTGCEKGDIQAVMDGQINEFVESYLHWAVVQQNA